MAVQLCRHLMYFSLTDFGNLIILWINVTILTYNNRLSLLVRALRLSNWDLSMRLSVFCTSFCFKTMQPVFNGNHPSPCRIFHGDQSTPYIRRTTFKHHQELELKRFYYKKLHTRTSTSNFCVAPDANNTMTKILMPKLMI